MFAEVRLSPQTEGEIKLRIAIQKGRGFLMVAEQKVRSRKTCFYLKFNIKISFCVVSPPLKWYITLYIVFRLIFKIERCSLSQVDVRNKQELIEEKIESLQDETNPDTATRINLKVNY